MSAAATVNSLERLRIPTVKEKKKEKKSSAEERKLGHARANIFLSFSRKAPEIRFLFSA